MRGCWFRTSPLSEQQISGIRIITEGSTGLSAVKTSDPTEKTFAMTVANGKTEPVTRQAVLVINFTPLPTVRSLSQRQIWKVSTNLWYATDEKADSEAMIGLREVRKKLEHATTSRWLYKKGDNGRARMTPIG